MTQTIKENNSISQSTSTTIRIIRENQTIIIISKMLMNSRIWNTSLVAKKTKKTIGLVKEMMKTKEIMMKLMIGMMTFEELLINYNHNYFYI